MKKKYYGYIFIVLMVITLPSFIIGYIFQQHYEKTLTLFSQQIKINLKLVDYKRHWFYSDAILAANFPFADKPFDVNNFDNDPKDLLIIKQHISHGPLIFNSNTHTSRVQIAMIHIDSFFDDQHHFAQTTMKFNRDLNTHFELNEYKKTNQQQLIYELNGLLGDLKIDHENSHLSSLVRIKHVASNIDNQREISNFVMSDELTKNNFEVWTGKKQYHFDTLKWGQSNKFFDFRNVNYILNSQLLNDRYKVNISAQAQSVLYNNKDYGPQNISFSISDLNAQQLKPLQESFALTNTQHFAARKHANDVQHHLLALLNQGANFKLNSLLLNTAWGQINIKADITCQCPNYATNFANLFSSVQTEVEGYFPADLADTLLTNYYALHFNLPDPDSAKRMAQESLANWQTSGWLQVSGEYFLIHLSEQPKKVEKIIILP